MDLVRDQTQDVKLAEGDYGIKYNFFEGSLFCEAALTLLS